MPYQSQANGKAANTLSRIYLTGTILQLQLLLNIIPQQQLQPQGIQQPIDKCNNKKKQHLGWPPIATSPTKNRVDTSELSATVRINGKEQYQPAKNRNQKTQWRAIANGNTKHGNLSVTGHTDTWMRTWPFRRRRWNGMSNLDNFYSFLGCIAVCVVDRESYGSDRCSVLILTGVFKLLL